MIDSVDILGISGSEKTDRLKANVQKALKVLNIEVLIKEVTSVDVLMQSNITAIPALRVNGRVVLQRMVPSVEDLKDLLKTYLEPPTSNFTMKHILVPTDFSKTAKGAYLFALELARKRNSSLQLLHCFHPEIDPLFPYLSDNLDVLLERKRTLLNQFKAHTLPPNEGGVATIVPVKTKLISGFATEEIVKLSTAPNVDMVVMGTTGGGNILTQLIGSVSSHVAKKAHCPVLLIPNGVRFRGFRNVLYASNYEVTDEILLQQVANFSGLFDTNIHVVHVVENHKLDYTLKAMQFEQIFREKIPFLNIKIATIQHRTVPQAIQEYASKNEIDLVVMATAHRSFIEDVLHKSMTKRMIFNTKVPLMVLHIDE